MHILNRCISISERSALNAIFWHKTFPTLCQPYNLTLYFREWIALSVSACGRLVPPLPLRRRRRRRLLHQVDPPLLSG